MKKKTDILIVGSGAAGLFCALNLPRDKKIVIITKDDMENSDSYLAQGGICVLKSEEDYDSYFEDTMKAGHYENRKESVDIMIRSSRKVIDDLILYGVDFENDHGSLIFTREGGHSTPRILFHEDITGKEITEKLLAAVKKLKNVTIYEHTTMVDLIVEENICFGAVVADQDKQISLLRADYTVLASGGLGGLYEHSTNFSHMTGDALAVAIKHRIELENIDYIQIHPTTLYSTKPGRRFLISESVRGEGAVLLNRDGERFVDELLPRDVLTEKVYEQMEKDGMPYVRLSLAPIPEEEIKGHFPNIYKRCLEEGFDVTKEPIPVVPAQHYFMGGIWVDSDSKTSMKQLFAIGETSCNGVHGANRLASNSLLESFVFAKRAAKRIARTYTHIPHEPKIDIEKYSDLERLREGYKELVLEEIDRVRNKRKEQKENE
ncbi:MAG: L-aspartate oxidase [Roseburia sp.]|nr:L-aspartate oxidase [Roseburia sp.]